MLTIISDGSVYLGDVFSADDIRIEGVVRGRVHARSAYVGPSAVLEGSLRVSTAVIAGRVIGDVVVPGDFVLKDGGSVTGNVFKSVLARWFWGRRSRTGFSSEAA